MTDEQLNRKLTAILSADAKGYSRLMGEDEVATIQTLKYSHEIMTREIQRYKGRVIDSPGDNLLAEFASIVDAVNCALNIQEQLKRSAADTPEDQKMPFRIGINLGDVIVDGGWIYGDGVNIAARLEGLAEAGGICISGSAYDQIQNKLAFGGEFIGEQQVKNIAGPIKVYKIWSDPKADGRIEAQRKTTGARRFRSIVAALVLILAGAVVFYAWQGYQKQRPAEDEPPLRQQLATPFSDRPSIAVLPFNNLSDDTEQEYFSDGITNDIITDLSKFRELTVTASNTVFKYKGKAIDIREVGRELSVDYVLEGSVQKAADRVRINAQLIDASNGNHVWADRFDRITADIFKLQDEIIENIVRKLALKIDQTERKRVFAKQTDNLEAHDYFLKAYHHFYQRGRDPTEKAKGYFKKAIELDPDYSDAYAGLADVRMREALFGYTEFPDLAFQQAEELAKKAIVLDESNALARANLGYIYMRKGQYDLAISELKYSIELNPNDYRTYRRLAPVLLYSGKLEEALHWYNMSMKYDRNHASSGTFMNMGIANFLKGKNDEALNWLNRSVAKWPTFLGNHIVLAAVHGHIGNLEEANKEARKVLSIAPFFEVDFYGEAFYNPEHRKKMVDGLRKAGLE